MEVYVVCYGFISIWSCACQTRSRCSLSFRFRTTLGELYLEFRDGPKSALFCLVVGRHSAAHLLQHCIALCWSSRRHLHAVALAEMRCLCRLLTCIVEYYCNADILRIFVDSLMFKHLGWCSSKSPSWRVSEIWALDTATGHGNATTTPHCNGMFKHRSTYWRSVSL